MTTHRWGVAAVLVAVVLSGCHKALTPAAEYQRGMAYAKGQGVPKNDYKAFYWYRKAAEQGFAAAEHQIGVDYDRGRGVPVNIQKAVHWYRKAAEQGYVRAEYAMGAVYFFGEDAPKNDKKAAYWFRKAAAQGDARAEDQLRALYNHKRVAADRVAENLAYRAYYNSDAAALATLKVRAKTDPAFRWGLYEFYSLEASHFGPNIDFPLLTKAVIRIGPPRMAESLRKWEALEARVETDQQKDQKRLQKKSLLLLEQAAAKNDPAAENSLAWEYWREPLNSVGSITFVSYEGIKMIKMNDENQAWFQAARRMCTDGFRLAQKSRAAGWPGAYMTIGMFHQTPKGPNERTSSAMTPTEFLLATHCMGQAYPSSIPSALRNSVALIRYAAQHGSIGAITLGEIAWRCSRGQKRATERWLRQLKELATAGSVPAQIDLKAAIAYAHSRCGVVWR